MSAASNSSRDVQKALVAKTKELKQRDKLIDELEQDLQRALQDKTKELKQRDKRIEELEKTLSDKNALIQTLRAELDQSKKRKKLKVPVNELYQNSPDDKLRLPPIANVTAKIKRPAISGESVAEEDVKRRIFNKVPKPQK